MWEYFDPAMPVYANDYGMIASNNNLVDSLGTGLWNVCNQLEN